MLGDLETAVGIVESAQFGGNHKEDAAESRLHDFGSAINSLLRRHEAPPAHDIAVVPEPARRPSIHEPVTVSYQSYIESVNEEESDIARSHSSNGTSSLSGQHVTDHRAPDLSPSHHDEPLGTYSRKISVGSNIQSKSKKQRNDSDLEHSEEEHFLTGENWDALTVANLERRTVADFNITLASLVKHLLPIYQPSRFTAAEPMIEDRGTRFMQSALREIPRFHSRIIGLFGTGLPNWDTFSRHPQDTSTAYEEVAFLDQYVQWARDLLMAMNYFDYRLRGIEFIETRPNTFDPQDLEMLLTRVFLDLWPTEKATKAKLEAVGDGRERFFLDTLRKIGGLNDILDEACAKRSVTLV